MATKEGGWALHEIGAPMLDMPKSAAIKLGASQHNANRKRISCLGVVLACGKTHVASDRECS